MSRYDDDYPFSKPSIPKYVENNILRIHHRILTATSLFMFLIKEEQKINRNIDLLQEKLKIVKEKQRE
jgi:hypothetical protein